LLTNDFLLYDPDWIRFFLRTVTPGQDLLPGEKVPKLNSWPALGAFIEWVLIRDPERRPTLQDVRQRFSGLCDSLTGITLTDTKFTVDSTFKGRKVNTLTSTECMLRGANVGGNTSIHFAPFGCLSNRAIVPAFPAAAAAGHVIGALLLSDDAINCNPTTMLNERVAGVLKCRRGPQCEKVSKSDLAHEDRRVATCTIVLPSVLCENTSELSEEAYVLFSKSFFGACLFVRGILHRHVRDIRCGTSILPSVLITYPSGERSSALALATAVHMHICGEGFYAATVALGMGVCASAAVLKPMDAQYLIEWDSRCITKARSMQEHPCFCCPYGCWCVYLVGKPLSHSFSQRNPMPCSASFNGSCESGCPGCCMHAGGCASILECIAARTKSEPTDILWWAYTDVDQLVPGIFCARADLASMFALSPQTCSTSFCIYDSPRGECPAQPKDVEGSTTMDEATNAWRWQLYSCSCCGCPTHAVAHGERNSSRSVAIIANWAEGVLMS